MPRDKKHVANKVADLNWGQSHQSAETPKHTDALISNVADTHQRERVVIQFNTHDIAYLDAQCLAIRNKRPKIKRAALLRAFPEALRQANVDLTDIASVDDFRLRLINMFKESDKLMTNA